MIRVEGKRVLKLFETLTTLWGIPVLAILLLLGYVTGGQPLFSIEWFKMTIWEMGITGILGCWSIFFAIFLQRKDDYIDTHTGNKSIGMLVLGIVVISIAWILVGKLANAWFFLVCILIQLLPLFLGDSLGRQAKEIGPHLVSAVLSIFGVIMLIIG